MRNRLRLRRIPRPIYRVFLPALGVRRLDVALRVAFLSFSLMRRPGKKKKATGQSGVEPPHSKVALPN